MCKVLHQLYTLAVITDRHTKVYGKKKIYTEKRITFIILIPGAGGRCSSNSFTLFKHRERAYTNILYHMTNRYFLSVGRYMYYTAANAEFHSIWVPKRPPSPPLLHICMFSYSNTPVIYGVRLRFVVYSLCMQGRKIPYPTL